MGCVDCCRFRLLEFNEGNLIVAKNRFLSCYHIFDMVYSLSLVCD